MKKIALIILVLATMPFLSRAQQENQVLGKVHDAIRTGDASGLSSWFHTTVDLELGDTDGNFSRNQAEMILKDFFTRNPVKSFTVKHQGSSDDGSKYSIGHYIAKNGQEYRVYVLLKQSEGGLRINQLQFEED